MRETIGGMMVREMLKAAEMNAKTTREEKTEMKSTNTEPKTYNCAISLSKEYTITANTTDEARDKAAMTFMAELIDDTPHELTPIINVRYADEVNETDEDDLDWDYEEDEEDDDIIPFRYHYYEENLGIESTSYEFGFEMVADIVKKFRLTAEEKAELERKVALLHLYD